MNLYKSSRLRLGGLLLTAVLIVLACGSGTGLVQPSKVSPTTSPTTTTFVPPPTTTLPTPKASLTVSQPPAPSPKPTPASTPSTYSENLYSPGGARYQNPDMTACTAAAAMIMLNFVAAKSPTPGNLSWAPTTSYATQESILAYEREHMTMLVSSAGSDPHGWRNALNYYGYGSINAGVYADEAFGSYTAAAKAAIIALAQTGKPVGILAWAGKHAQILNGFVVTGDDPASGSAAFTIQTVYITDPLASDGYRNYSITNVTWQSGNSHIAFVPYHETDSPYTDPIDGQVGKTEWYNKWVIIAPIR